MSPLLCRLCCMVSNGSQLCCGNHNSVVGPGKNECALWVWVRRGGNECIVCVETRVGGREAPGATGTCWWHRVTATNLGVPAGNTAIQQHGDQHSLGHSQLGLGGIAWLLIATQGSIALQQCHTFTYTHGRLLASQQVPALLIGLMRGRRIVQCTCARHAAAVLSACVWTTVWHEKQGVVSHDSCCTTAFVLSALSLSAVLNAHVSCNVWVQCCIGLWGDTLSGQHEN